jgi:hypothetical protein
MIRSRATRRACDIPQHCIVYTSPLSAPNKAPSKAFHTRAVEIPVSYLLTFPPGFPPGTTRPIMASPAPRPWPCQVRPPCTPVVFSDLSFPRQASHSHDTAARRHVRWSCVHNNLPQRGWGRRSKASTYSGRHGWHVWGMAAVPGEILQGRSSCHSFSSFLLLHFISFHSFALQSGWDVAFSRCLAVIVLVSSVLSSMAAPVAC